ncbi:response regulator [Actinoplanes flavus]|uniref:Response regulator n=1 Tax=Actinoplanes flavus TaxID=2820290 RepID=A0ABS3UIK9_9ACTN|nr:response regulator [Actinoplanes flavus]MBO3738046.1 response regulator [Actinoplanes flavus]
MVALLIAEDDEDISLVLARVFKRAGMTVLRASDGWTAFETIVEQRPDVVLTDLGMPRMDGWELIDAIRSHEDKGIRHIPVAILSGHLRPGDPRAGSSKVCAILLKPCPNDQLLATMEELVTIGPHDHDTVDSRCPADLPVSV